MMWLFKKKKTRKKKKKEPIRVVLEVGEKLRSLFNRLLFTKGGLIKVGSWSTE